MTDRSSQRDSGGQREREISSSDSSQSPPDSTPSSSHSQTSSAGSGSRSQTDSTPSTPRTQRGASGSGSQSPSSGSGTATQRSSSGDSTQTSSSDSTQTSPDTSTQSERQISVSRTHSQHGVEVGTGRETQISLSERSTVYVIEVEDVLFRHDSAVLLPEAYEEAPDEASDEDQERITGIDVLKHIYIRVKEFLDQKMLITGHTDTTGRDAYNVMLSELRANSVGHMLMNEKEEWAEISDGKHKDEDIQQILKYAAKRHPSWNCDPGEIDGVIGPLTRTATENFQTGYNTDFGQDIGVDGVVGPQTWGAFFDLYRRELARKMDTDEDGLQTYIDDLNWVSDDKKAVGCGENFPIEEPAQDEYRSRINRRVETLFFDPSEVPPIPCHSEEGECMPESCLIHDRARFNKEHIPVHPQPRPQSKPTFLTPKEPGSSEYIRINSLNVYVLNYRGETDTIVKSNRYLMKNGKLCDVGTEDQVTIDCDRDTFFYFSHRTDLFSGSGASARFRRDRSRLPLIGPIHVPCGADAEIRLDIWSQNDWYVVRGVEVDGMKPNRVLMAEWQENYTVGYYGHTDDGTRVFCIYGDHREKDQQEKWTAQSSGTTPIPLVNFAPSGSDPLWIGTLSELPADEEAKILLEHRASGGTLYCASFNQVIATGNNIIVPSHHVYKRDLVQRLMALPADDIPPASIDAFPDPPARMFLPGDICWHDQGQTNNCGAYSFAAAMNYWRPYQNNPLERGGAYYSEHVDKLLIPNGARTPAHIEDAAGRFGMSGRNNDAEELYENSDRERAMKLIKLWLWAGVPVLVLVEEYYNLFSLHWKVIVGYDGNRFFICNSGGDDEYNISSQEAGVDYEHAPIGNDVDTANALYNKWSDSGGGIADALSSVDTCTFIPVYPNDDMFAGDEPQ